MRRTLSGKKVIWERLTDVYGSLCVYCHKNLATQLDHVIPYSLAGYHGIDNLRPSCAWCNLHLSNKVFDDFDDKYIFARALLKNKKRSEMLTCSSCLLPFYSFLQRNTLFCNYCYSLEYDQTNIDNLAWSKWVDLLSISGIDCDAHFKLADYLHETKATINKADKVRKIQDFSNVKWFDTFEYIF